MENLDLREILKDVPKGTKLYSTTHGDICFDCVDFNDNIYPIKCYEHCCNYDFTKEGKYHYNYDGECILFPSKEQRDWRKFIAKPFQNGDVISTNVGNVENIAIFSHYSPDDAIVYHCVITNNKIEIKQSTGIGYHRNCHLASQEEKEKLYTFLQEEGYFWDTINKSLKKYKFEVGHCITTTGEHKHVITQIKHNKYIVTTDDKYFKDEILCGYQENFNFYQEKFDITTLKPYDKVLTRHGNGYIWKPQLFSYLDINVKEHCYKFAIVGGGSVPQCIPYEGNEHLTGTKNKCDEYYKTWE